MRISQLLSAVCALTAELIPLTAASSLFPDSAQFAVRAGRRSSVELFDRDVSSSPRLHRRNPQQNGGAPAKSNPASSLPSKPASTTPNAAAVQKWEVETSNACNQAMNKLGGKASNPSGMAVCYNLAFLDRKTGVFEAELRIYNISEATGDFKGVTSKDVSLSFSYLGATVQAVDGPQIVPQNRRRQAPPEGTPQFVKSVFYVGQLNSNVMGSAMTDADLQPLLVPNIGLSAISPVTTQQVSTSLSSTEASFVNGVFSNKAIAQADTTGAAASASASALAATATAFVLPGTTLGAFPVGLVVTLVWTFLFILTVGLGTIGRQQFRMQFRRRKRRENWAQIRKQ